ncbi:MAG: hypothetical protein ACXABY_30860 [Candidatus Thorarchaeota archaeon]|jgi:hypothetical protein
MGQTTFVDRVGMAAVDAMNIQVQAMVRMVVMSPLEYAHSEVVDVHVNLVNGSNCIRK